MQREGCPPTRAVVPARRQLPLAVPHSTRAPEVCSAAAESLGALADWNTAGIKSALSSAGERLGVRGRELFQPVRAALQRVLEGHEPYPAVAVNRAGEIVAANDASGVLMEDVAPELLRF